MRYIRTQAIVALIGLAIVASLLYTQSQGLVTKVLPACGGTFTEAAVGTPERFNPLLDATNPAERDVDKLLFSGLMKFGTDGRPVVDLAQSYAVSNDGLSYTFVIKPGLTWHDGQPVTEQDVLFTIGLMQDSNFPGPKDLSAFWQKIKVSSPSANAVRFELPEPFAPFLDYTTIGLLPQHLLNGTKAADLAASDFNQNPVGTGLLKMSKIERANGMITSVTLESNETCANEQNYLHNVSFRYYPDAASAYDAFSKGQVQATSDFSTTALKDALANPNVNVYTGRLPQYSLIFMNQKTETISFFQEKKVRQALMLGMNRQWIIDNLLHGQALIATGPVLPGTWAYDDNLVPVAFDPTAAANLLNDAGWALPAEAVKGSPAYVRTKKEISLKFTLLVPNDQLHIAIGNQLKTDWAAIGVQVTITTLPVSEIKKELDNRTFEAAMIDLNFTTTPDPDPYPFWHQTQIENGQNYSSFNNRDISEILEQARTTPSYSDRAKFYRAFQSKFADQTPALLLYYPVYNYAVDKKVSGVQMGPLIDPSDRFNNLSDWYMLTRRVIENVGGQP